VAGACRDHERCRRRQGRVRHRLADLDRKGIISGAISADSAPIVDSRALYHDGILSHVNRPASLRGGRVGMKLKDFIEILIAAAKR
jgi:hypothetical protein